MIQGGWKEICAGGEKREHLAPTLWSQGLNSEVARVILQTAIIESGLTTSGPVVPKEAQRLVPWPNLPYDERNYRNVRPRQMATGGRTEKESSRTKARDCCANGPQAAV